MAVNLKGRSFLTLEDFTPAEIRYLLDLGHALKAKRRAGICDPVMKGKHIVLLFEKTSTRTRCSFEVAATQEGAHVTYLDAGTLATSSAIPYPINRGCRHQEPRYRFCLADTLVTTLLTNLLFFAFFPLKMTQNIVKYYYLM